MTKNISVCVDLEGSHSTLSMTPISWDRNIRIIGIFYTALGNLHILAISFVHFIKYRPTNHFRRKGQNVIFISKFLKMMRLSIITPIDHQLKGTNLHKILVLYHLQLRRAIRPRCRTNILMRGNHRTAPHSVTLSTNILIFQCHHHSFSPSHPPGI